MLQNKLFMLFFILYYLSTWCLCLSSIEFDLQMTSLHKLSAGGQIVGYTPGKELGVILRPEHTGDVFLWAEGIFHIL